MDMTKCTAVLLTCIFKTYISIVHCSIQIFFIEKNISTNARKMPGKI